MQARVVAGHDILDGSEESLKCAFIEFCDFKE